MRQDVGMKDVRILEITDEQGAGHAKHDDMRAGEHSDGLAGDV